jgi:hypothetical protein
MGHYAALWLMNKPFVAITGKLVGKYVRLIFFLSSCKTDSQIGCYAWPNVLKHVSQSTSPESAPAHRLQISTNINSAILAETSSQALAISAK